MKRIDWSLIGIIFGLVMIAVMVFGAMFVIASAAKEGESFIGKEVVLSNDTLMVMNYSLLKSSYDLSNGLTIDQNLLQSLELIEP